MSHRVSTYVTGKRKANGGVSPNAFKPWVSAEIRIFWPPLASEDQVLDLLFDLYQQAVTDVKNKKRSPPPAADAST